jgi:GNAT superfamily N-acetyltransferase
MLATPNGMGNIIVGYIVWEPGADKTLIHYIYTKQDYRNMGLASYLIDTIKGDKELIATARGSRFRELTYNPYLLIEGNKDGEESNNEKDSTSTETSTKDD